ncbi:unnamed protein product [Orchesella dallaii]|uniref:Uncharacterized protein n=1 Tax=Orchesella dallaii TaxID=48710 RepID=A0ABP1QHB3_9HEXA
MSLNESCTMSTRATTKGDLSNLEFCIQYKNGEYFHEFSQFDCDDDGGFLECCDDVCKCCQGFDCPDDDFDGDGNPTCYELPITGGGLSRESCTFEKRATTKGALASPDDNFCVQYKNGEYFHKFAEEDCNDGGYLVCCDGTCQCCNNEYCPDKEYDANGNPTCYSPPITGGGLSPGRVVVARNASEAKSLKRI